MILKKYILIIFILFSTNLLAQNIRVIDLDLILNESDQFKNFIVMIESDQIEYKKLFKKKEIQLQSQLKKVENSKLILNEDAFEKLIINYNIELDKFTSEVEKFNLHYESQIIKIKNKLLTKILDLTKEYSQQNKIELILDSNNYIIAINDINITNIILGRLNKLNFEFELEQYK